jgi:mycoredoxin
MAYIMTGSGDKTRLGNIDGLGYVETLMAVSNAPLTMYTTSWCGYCFRLKTVLKAEGITYTEIDIESDPVAAEFVMSVNGGNQTVPTLKFPDGSTLTNPGAREVKAKLPA